MTPNEAFAELKRLKAENARLQREIEVIHNVQNELFDGNERLVAENAKLRAAMTLFVRCAYPVAIEINPRGHAWMPEKNLDYALDEARKILNEH